MALTMSGQSDGVVLQRTPSQQSVQDDTHAPNVDRLCFVRLVAVKLSFEFKSSEGYRIFAHYLGSDIWETPASLTEWSSLPRIFKHENRR